MHPRYDFDVAVIGAGLAGAAAAAQLTRAGLDVVILEAGERVGGRAYSRPFTPSNNEATTDMLEFGGAWITPWHTRLRELVAEHALSFRPRPMVTRRQWYRDGGMHDLGPTSNEDRPQHERAIARVAVDATLYKHGAACDKKGGFLANTSFADYLTRLAAPRPTRNLFSAWWSVSGNGDPATTSATEFLSSCEYGGGLAEGMIDQWIDSVSPGMSVLIERLIAASRARLELNTCVSAVIQSQDSVFVETPAGRRVTCRAAVLALGINQLNGLRFAPQLAPAKVRAIELGHGGCAFKVWIKVRNVAVGTLVTGNGAGLEWAFAERLAADGTTLIVGFGITGKFSRPNDPDWVKSEVAKLLPNAIVLGHDCHDWVNDRFARGTWVANKLGGSTAMHADNWREEGLLYFASSDFAQDQAGWFEGAVLSGERASAALLERIRVEN